MRGPKKRKKSADRRRSMSSRKHLCPSVQDWQIIPSINFWESYGEGMQKHALVLRKRKTIPCEADAEKTENPMENFPLSSDSRSDRSGDEQTIRKEKRCPDSNIKTGSKAEETEGRGHAIAQKLEF